MIWEAITKWITFSEFPCICFYYKINLVVRHWQTIFWFYFVTHFISVTNYIDQQNLFIALIIWSRDEWTVSSFAAAVQNIHAVAVRDRDGVTFGISGWSPWESRHETRGLIYSLKHKTAFFLFFFFPPRHLGHLTEILISKT